MRSYHDASGAHRRRSRARVAEGLSRWPEDERERVHVVFSAHSLPERVLAGGDPYDAQCRETARLVAERAGFRPSAGRGATSRPGARPSPGPGPTSASTSKSSRVEGVRDVVSVPVGFVSDHVELLFDVDVRARRDRAESSACASSARRRLNDDPRFVAALAEIVRDRAAAWTEARAA